MTPSESPPPYSPNDPYAPPSPERRTSPQLGDDDTLAGRPLSLRGGDLRPMPSSATDPYLSPTAYFEERNFESDIIPSLMVLDVDIHPATKRDDMLFPLSDADRELRDVTDQDWATFINYLLTELGSDEISGESEKGRRWGSMNPQEFFHAKAKMENIVNEWNEAFFMPRGLHFNAKFSFNPPTITPTTSQADSETVVERSERSYPDTESTASSREAPFDESPQAGPHHPLQHAWMNWGRGRGSWPQHGGFGGRGRGFGPGVGPWQRNIQHAWTQPHHGHNPWEHRVHTPWEHHVRVPWEHHSHSRPHPDGRTHHRRSSSVSSSSSSSSSDSSCSSLSVSDISDVDAEQVRQAIAAFRQDPLRKEHLKLAVRGLHNTLKAQHQSKPSRRCSGNSSQRSKAEYRNNRESVKAELRGLREEVRKYRREKKQDRSAKKRARRSERDAEKRARKAEKRAAETANKLHRSTGSSHSEAQEPSSSRHMGYDRGVADINDPLIPPIDVLNRQDSSGQPYRLSDLSKSDRKLENAARHIEMQADSMDHYARHWGQQAEHYTHMYAQHDVSERYVDERREAHFATVMASNPQKAHKLEEALAKQREKARKNHDKRVAKAEDMKQKLLAQQQKVAEAAQQLRQQAAQTRAKMEYASVRGDSASQSSRETASERDAAESGNYWERKGKAIGSWGERFGRDMEVWGNRFGRDMEAWGVRVGRDAETFGTQLGARAQIPPRG